MTRFSATVIDFSTFPPPDALETLDYETLLAEAIAQFMAQWNAERAKRPALPAFETIDLESEPVRKVLETHAYLLLQTRQRVNDAVRSTMVATAAGADLENLALFYGVVRVEGEDDTSLRGRVILAPEGFSTAGPVGAYQFHAISADPTAIKDVSVLNPRPGQVQLVVQAREGNGQAPAPLLSKVLAAVNRDEVVPHTDMVSVVSVKVRTYAIDAGLILYPGPDANVVLAAARAAAMAYAKAVSRIGQDVTISGLYAALQQPGVQRVNLRSPLATMTISDSEASYCTAVAVTVDGRDE